MVGRRLELKDDTREINTGLKNPGSRDYGSQQRLTHSHSKSPLSKVLALPGLTTILITDNLITDNHPCQEDPGPSLLHL